MKRRVKHIPPDPILVEAGYCGDGVGMYSHVSAKSKQPRPTAAQPQSVRTIIQIEEHKLRKLYAKHRAGIDDPVKLAQVRHNIDIAQTFIAKLWAELGEEIKRGRA